MCEIQRRMQLGGKEDFEIGEQIVNGTKNSINSCGKLEIPFYDCNEFLKQNSKRTDWLFVDRAHMNDDGYMLISEYIKSKI